MGGKAWVFARRAEQIEIEECLGDETVPLLGWEVGVTRGESRAKVILEGANHTFGGVATMGIWRDKLEVDIVFSEGFCMVLGHLLLSMWIVGAAPSCWRCPCHVIQTLVIFQGLPVLQKLGVDGVGVVVVEDEYKLVSAGREYRETACLVRL